MPEKNWVNVNIQEEIVKLIDKIVESKKYGYVSRSDFAQKAVIDKLKELGVYPPRPRFEHYNVYEDHVSLIDREMPEGKEWIDIFFRGGKPYCEFHESFDCEHIRFILELPKIISMLKERGWLVKDGKLIER